MIEDKLRENAELHPDKLALLCNGQPVVRQLTKDEEK